MTFSSFCSQASNFIWGPFMLLFILCVGLYLSSISGFFQLTSCHRWISAILPKHTGSLKSLFTALGGSIGIGSIAGVASALSLGGPGALFWMWISAFLGMMIKFSEIALSVQYRKKTLSGYRGGPMYYIQKAFHCKTLSILFCIFTVFASFGIGGMCQSNALASSFFYTTKISPTYMAIPFLCVYAFFLFQKPSSISTFSTYAIPSACICYLALGILYLFIYISDIPFLFQLILKDAFSPLSAGSGIIGFFSSQCVRAGISRGIFSNEAGLGSAPIIHSEAKKTTPYREGLFGIVEVFISTMLICTVSGLIFLLSQIKMGFDFSVSTDHTLLALQSFSCIFPEKSVLLLGIAICLFAFTAPLGWSLCGRRALEYLFPQKKYIILIYKILLLFSLYLGFFLQVKLVWQISDLFNALMTLPNLLSLIILSKEIRYIIHNKN